MSTVAALVVTNRPAFIPWWKHQIEKQTRQVDEVIVVDNRADLSTPWIAGGCQGPLGGGWFAKHVPPTTSLGEMRQVALDLCDSDIVMWFDDDDWYHPRRVELLADPIERGLADGSAMPMTHRLYLRSMMLWPMGDGVGLHIQGTAWRRSLVSNVRFAALGCGEDSVWIQEIVGNPIPPWAQMLGQAPDFQPSKDMRKPWIPYSRIRWNMTYDDPNIGGILLVHGSNVWQGVAPREPTLQSVTGRPFYTFPPKDVSREQWAETWRLIEDLRSTLKLRPE